MAKKKRKRSQVAVRGTAADPNRVAADSEVKALRCETREGVRKSAKLVGVMPEHMADEVQRTGSFPFTFKSAFILGAAALAGTIVIPFFATQAGGDIGTATTASLPPLLALALAYTRFFIDSKRGFTKGFAATFIIAFIILLVLCWLLFFHGIML